AGLTDQQILAQVNANNRATQTDRDLFTRDARNLTHGNHTATVVTYEMTGRYNIQRFPGLFTATANGAGLGDLNFDGTVNAADVALFSQVLATATQQFTPAADLNGDALIDNSDLLWLWQRLLDVGADEATLAAYLETLGPPPGGYVIAAGQDVTLALALPPGNVPPLTYDWDM